MATALQTVSKEELKQIIDQGKPVQIVNELGEDFYNLGSIKGSLKIPVAELDKRARQELDQSKDVITYCANSHCTKSREGAEKLASMGYHVRAYEGGIEEWKKAGLPTEETQGAGTPYANQPNAGNIDQPSGLSGTPRNRA